MIKLGNFLDAMGGKSISLIYLKQNIQCLGSRNGTGRVCKKRHPEKSLELAINALKYMEAKYFVVTLIKKR